MVPSYWKKGPLQKEDCIYDHMSKGIKEVRVDNKIVETQLVPVFKDNKSHQVNVLMG